MRKTIVEDPTSSIQNQIFIQGDSEESHITNTIDTVPPLSPATPAEHFFLQSITKQTDLTAVAIAARAVSKFKNKHDRLRKGEKVDSVASFSTSEFQSCAENLEDIKDDLRFFQRSLVELENETETKTEVKLDLPSHLVQEKPKKVSIDIKYLTMNEDMIKLDPSQHLYGGLKNVWGWGSNFVLTKPFSKLTEAAAGKVLDMTTGIDFDKLDKEIQPKLAQIDEEVLNPAVTQVFEVVEPIVMKAQTIIGVVASPVLGSLGLIKKEPVVEKPVEEIPNQS